jgi:copper chaperone NosL
MMVWLGVVCLAAAWFFPLWSISLTAPQYPEGLGLSIWVSKISGRMPHDLTNINRLNHYIGMKEIEPVSIPELRYMPFILAALIFLGIMTGLVRRRALLLLWAAALVAVSLAGLADFYRWEYDYGHNLDSSAPIKVPGMSYQPPLIGSKRLLNIDATSWPAAGGLMMALGVALAVAGLFLEWFRRGAGGSRGVRVSLILPLLLLFAACAPQPEPIAFGSDACASCRMTIADGRYGAEIVTGKGKVTKYDSVECMVRDLLSKEQGEGDAHSLLVIDYSNPGEFTDAARACYLRSPTLHSPMGMDLTSFRDSASAEVVRSAHPGSLLDWSGVKSLVGQDEGR